MIMRLKIRMKIFGGWTKREHTTAKNIVSFMVRKTMKHEEMSFGKANLNRI